MTIKKVRNSAQTDDKFKMERYKDSFPTGLKLRVVSISAKQKYVVLVAEDVPLEQLWAKRPYYVVESWAIGDWEQCK